MIDFHLHAEMRSYITYKITVWEIWMTITDIYGYRAQDYTDIYGYRAQGYTDIYGYRAQGYTDM